jgi:integrase
MKFTQASVDRFKMPDGKSEHIEFDDNMPGFGLRVRANGKEHRTFIVQYKIGAKHRRVTLGNVKKVTLENARAEAKRIFGKIAHGKDPAAEKEVFRDKAAHTFGATITKYLEARQGKLRARSYGACRYVLEAQWLPLHGLALDSITRAHVAAEISAIAKRRGPSSANRARTVLSAFYRWCIGEGLTAENPVIGTNTQAENGPRERSLTDAEAAAVWLACPDSNDYGRIVRLLMLTGCRRVEIGDLHWSEINLESRSITLPGSRTKNGREHVVPLCDAAVAIIEAIPRRNRDLVFGIGRGGFSGWAKAKGNIDKLLQFKTAWTLHDIRRTVRTGLGMLGVLPHVAEAALNHLPPKLIRTYDRNTYEPEKRAALELWASHLAVAIAQATGTNVTRLPSNKTA